MQETWFPSLVGKIPWNRKWQPTPVFLPVKSHGVCFWGLSLLQCVSVHSLLLNSIPLYGYILCVWTQSCLILSDVMGQESDMIHIVIKTNLKNMLHGEFPGDPVARTRLWWCFYNFLNLLKLLTWDELCGRYNYI